MSRPRHSTEFEIDISNTKWTGVRSLTLKYHYCPSSLLPDLLVDLKERYGEECETKPITTGLIDLPGMIMTDRPIEELEVDGFTLKIPSQDFEVFAGRLFKLTPRRFNSGKEYYKLHGWMQCLVLTPSQHAALLSLMDKMLPEVSKRGKEADKEFSRRMRVLNEKSPIKVASHRDKESPDVIRVPEPKKDCN